MLGVRSQLLHLERWLLQHTDECERRWCGLIGLPVSQGCRWFLQVRTVNQRSDHHVPWLELRSRHLGWGVGLSLDAGTGSITPDHEGEAGPTV